MVYYQNIAFIANAPQLDEEIILPYDLGNDFLFRRADKYEAKIIQDVMPRTFSDFNIHKPYYVERNYAGLSWHHSTPLSDEECLLPDEWRYYVVEHVTDHGKPFPQDSGLFDDINSCLYLTNRFVVPILIHQKDYDHSYKINFSAGNEFYGPFSYIDGRPLRTINEADLDRLKQTYSVLLSLKSSGFAFIFQAIHAYRDNTQIPSRNSIKIIELFSIIELLISHKPDDNDSYGSITQQLCNKLNLISNRLIKPFDIESYFIAPQLTKDDKARSKTIWARMISKLYSYRSGVAHGNPIDFNKDFKPLKGPENVIKFLEEELLPKLLQFALQEPQLIQDLKSC